jgi:hypothetical protein
MEIEVDRGILRRDGTLWESQLTTERTMRVWDVDGQP